MPSPSHHPHDHFFRTTFGQVEIVREYLIQFLPTNILSQINLETLTEENTSFLDDQLEETFTDIIYRCKIGEGDATISILFEQKSYVPAHPWLQLLKYLVNSFQTQEREEEFNGVFRPVLPIVVYHGEKKWIKKPIPKSFHTGSKPLFPFLPVFDYLLTDLSQYSEEEILRMEGTWIKRVFLALKVSRQHRAFSWLKDLLDGLDLTLENHPSSNFVQWIIVYLFKTGSSKEEFMKAMNQLNTPQRKQTLSLYDQLLMEGEEKGIQKGLQKGIQTGIQRGSLLAQFQAFKNGVNMGHEPDSIALLIGIEQSLALEWEALLRNDPNAELPE